MTPSIVILISGRGSNMEAIVRAQQAGDISADISAVIANRPQAPGLLFAQKMGLATACVDHQAFEDRVSFEGALIKEIDQFGPDLVVLAGFMRVLTEGFVRHYEGRLLNIHPSLLPAFPGLHTHARALEAGVKWHGCTVHFVTPNLDCGPIIIQAAVPVFPDDDETALSSRVLSVEHHIYPKAVQWFVKGQLEVSAGRVRVVNESEAQQFFLSNEGR